MSNSTCNSEFTIGYPPRQFTWNLADARSRSKEHGPNQDYWSGSVNREGMSLAPGLVVTRILRVCDPNPAGWKVWFGVLGCPLVSSDILWHPLVLFGFHWVQPALGELQRRKKHHRFLAKNSRIDRALAMWTGWSGNHKTWVKRNEPCRFGFQLRNLADL